MKTLLATELRIGNTIQWLHEEHETFHTVTSEMISIIDRYNKNPDDEDFTRGFWYAGIPFTEDWLKKAQYEYIEESGYWHDSKHCVNLRDDGKALFMPFCTNDVDCFIELEFVHELQNLVFALDKTELEFKP